MPKISQRPALTVALWLRDRLAVEEVAVDHDGALELATGPNARYLWLARRLTAELVTLDT
ncbi:hypothetical protein [Bradyrhizobium sp. Ash2021]|uniref:hypothetical protein n=1 Tax=Bradyrhizobium sp. Ash2021 TaxID=2954771 RepID=UPI0028159D9B|nr:hypothetical protein [Bradyrhizobium sp. Ash2021]WMT75402.1 hypothetical protein NL528_02935 [Bradyrhizobium sp. Ash2021]